MTNDVLKLVPHTPAHLFQANAIYLITGSTYQKRHYLLADSRKRAWLDSFRTAAEL